MFAGPAMRAFLIVLGLAYPVLVYWGHGSLPPTTFILAALLLIALRYVLAPAGPLHLSHPTVLIVGGALLALSLVDQSLASLAYPSLISFAFASVFGLSLRYPPSLIERFARARNPDLPDAAKAYCANVTLLWTVWLIANGVIAAALAFSHKMELWLLWTSLLNYLVSGGLFGGEWLFRRIRHMPT
ncbi:hypothetical protein [Bosea sp. BK604]|uniref:COG4648 family protein n=1 Tax=Bosea sp. BK604 TaxID=2512180 RepID=UPI001052CC05|nr:hypothetical protein [Bosea sp. BK604]TCR64033.1 putative membrane protein [Bosea sp. BK604]